MRAEVVRKLKTFLLFYVTGIYSTAYVFHESNVLFAVETVFSNNTAYSDL